MREMLSRHWGWFWRSLVLSALTGIAQGIAEALLGINLHPTADFVLSLLVVALIMLFAYRRWHREPEGSH